jgi:hypothetical protein
VNEEALAHWGAVAPKPNKQNEVGDNTFYTKISTYLPNYMILHSRHHIFTFTAVRINSVFHILSNNSVILRLEVKIHT